MITAITRWVDNLTQMLTTASLWIQIPVVLIVALVVCSVLALFLLRAVDMGGALVHHVGNSLKRKDVASTSKKKEQ